MTGYRTCDHIKCCHSMGPLREGLLMNSIVIMLFIAIMWIMDTLRYETRKGQTNLDFTEARDSEWQWHQLGHMQVWTSLQTIRDAILMCNQKWTWNYRMEPTTKKWKTEKLKSKKRVYSEASVNSQGNPWSQYWTKKGKLWWEEFAEKEGFKPRMKEWGMMEY